VTDPGAGLNSSRIPRHSADGTRKDILEQRGQLLHRGFDMPPRRGG
jgi:hypothetical protein